MLVLERHERTRHLRDSVHAVFVRGFDIVGRKQRLDDGELRETMGVLPQQSQDVAPQIFFVHLSASLGTSLSSRLRLV